MFEELIALIKEQIFSNQFASGGLIIMILGSMGGFVYKFIIPIIKNTLEKKFIIKIDIQSNDDVFIWFTQWISTQKFMLKNRLLSVGISKSGINDNTLNDDDNETDIPKLVFSPAPGNHFFFYKGRLVWINRDRKEPSMEKGEFFLYEKFTIKMLGMDRTIAMQMVEDAREFIKEKERGKTAIYINRYSNWNRLKLQHRRKISSVILKNNLQDKVLHDVKWFIKNEKWYLEKNIPYRRGYLLHGEPGTGKTSLVKAIAGEIKSNLYSINFSKDMSDNDFTYLMTNLPTHSILLIEDIDFIFEKRKKKDEDIKVSFRTLLNVMDGVLSPEGVMIFLTTNHKEKLDKALLRAGRIDMDCYIGYSTKEQTEKLFENFYGNTNGKAKLFSKNILKKITPSEIINHFLINKNDMNAAIENIKLLNKKHN